QIQARPSMMNPVAMSDGSQTAKEMLDVPAAFRRQLEGLYEKYLKLQVALADDRVNEAKTAFAQLPAAIESPDVGLLEGRVAEAWYAARAKLKRAFAGDWKSIDVEELRKRYQLISKAMLDIVERFGHTQDAGLHRAYCPMAFENKGAAWLQAGKTIANPYFGHKMLRCGKIQRDFPAVADKPPASSAKEARP
ncbi:MAG: DUF3347 domain-containing protein, partial [Planctomycetota bacterium]|nr:DUF3347 domain-containing protein [Planctomycetota bacterium]